MARIFVVDNNAVDELPRFVFLHGGPVFEREHRLCRGRNDHVHGLAVSLSVAHRPAVGVSFVVAGES